MASRPVFVSPSDDASLVHVVSVDFVWHAGMARSQKQKSIHSLHDAIRTNLGHAKILEVSTMSEEPLGQRLSAFNLTFRTVGRGREIAVECAFQSSKVFENGGPYLDLLEVPPIEAKRDPRLQNSGRLVGFRFFDQDWPLEPQTAFYDWIYANALHQQAHLATAAMKYSVFTDIAFNPDRSINCQAGAVALYVSLRRRSMLKTALASREDFLATIGGAHGRKARIDTSPQGRLL